MLMAAKYWGLFDAVKHVRIVLSPRVSMQGLLTFYFKLFFLNLGLQELWSI